jgi:hypothetical protein
MTVSAMAGPNAPFFIVGTGRSGTTLLRIILAGHSRIEIPPETWFIMPRIDRIPLTGRLTPAQVELAVAIMTTAYRRPDVQIEAGVFGTQARALQDPHLGLKPRDEGRLGRLSNPTGRNACEA